MHIYIYIYIYICMHLIIDSKTICYGIHWDNYHKLLNERLSAKVEMCICGKSDFCWNVSCYLSALSFCNLGFLVAQTVKSLPTIQETQVQSLGQENPLEKEIATHSNILAWEIPWTEEAGGLESMELHRVRHDWVINSFTFFTVILGKIHNLSSVK